MLNTSSLSSALYRSIFFMLSCLALLSDTNSAYADGLHLTLTAEEKEWIQAHPHILVGGSADKYPFSFVTADSQYSGITNDYLKLLAKKTGLQFNSSTDQWDHNLQKIRDKKIDLLTTVYYSDERSQYLIFSPPYFKVIDYFFIRNDLKVSTVSDLDGMRVALPREYAQIKLLQKHYPTIKIVTVDSLADAIDAVLEGKADLLLDSSSVISYALQQNGIKSITSFKPAHKLSEKLVYIATRKDAPELASIIKKGLEAITDTEKKYIHNKWLNNSSPSNKPAFLSIEERKWLNQLPKLQLSASPQWLPYGDFNHSGEYVGMIAEYLKLIEHKLGITFSINEAPTAAIAAEQLKQKTVDIVADTQPSDTQSSLLFSHPLLATPIVIVMQKEAPPIDHIEQIADKKIAIIKSYGYATQMRKKYPQINFLNVDTVQEGLLAISTGKIDALIAGLAPSTYYMTTLGINNVGIVTKTELTNSISLLISKELKPLLPLLNRALNTIDNQQKQHIFKQWGEAGSNPQTDFSLISKILTLCAVLLLLLIAWIQQLTKKVSKAELIGAQAQSVLDSIPLHILVTSFEGQILTANKNVIDDYKPLETKISDLQVADFYHDPKERDMVLDELQKNGEIKQRIVKFKRIDGSVQSMMLSMQTFNYHNQKALLATSVDITDRLTTETIIKKAIESAQKAQAFAEKENREKSEFLATTSHEIRTQTNAIIGFAELLNDQLGAQKENTNIQTMSKALLALTTNILDLSKLETGKLQITKSSCNPHELFANIAALFNKQVKDKNIEFILDIEKSIPQHLLLDTNRLQQVLLNLINNAIKFTSQGHIQVKVRSFNNSTEHLELLIEIADTGAGLSAKQQQLILQNIESTKPQETTKYGSAGMGLSITKRLIETMRGTINLRSELGQGSTFSISLRKVEIVSSRKKPDQQDLSNLKHLFPIKLLVVDHKKNNQDLLQAILNDSKFQVMFAVSGAAATQLCQQYHFNVILMDIYMPTLDDSQAIRKIKVCSKAPIIALTESLMKDEFALVKNDFFASYLRRSAPNSELLHMLSTLLEQHKTTKQ